MQNYLYLNQKFTKFIKNKNFEFDRSKILKILKSDLIEDAYKIRKRSITWRVNKKGTFKKGDKIYINDFDNNGTIEQIICYKIGEKFFPIVDRDELISQLPYLKKKFVRFNNYASASIENIFNTKNILQK